VFALVQHPRALDPALRGRPTAWGPAPVQGWSTAAASGVASGS